MKIKLSKSQWQFIGKKAGWIKTAERDEKYCEVCGNLMGTMSDDAWIAAGKICDECGEKKDKEEGTVG